jgi:hypothetical protein
VQTSFGMRPRFFQRGIRGKRPSALLWRLNRSCYEGQLAGYQQYLDARGVAADIGAKSERSSLDNPNRSTRGERIVAGVIAGGCLICASSLASPYLSVEPCAQGRSHGDHRRDARILCVLRVRLPAGLIREIAAPPTISKAPIPASVHASTLFAKR